MEDKNTLIQTVALHYVLLRNKAEMDQFCEGLKELGVLNALRNYPDLIGPLFMKGGLQTLTAGLIMTLYMYRVNADYLLYFTVIQSAFARYFPMFISRRKAPLSGKERKAPI